MCEVLHLFQCCCHKKQDITNRAEIPDDIDITNRDEIPDDITNLDEIPQFSEFHLDYKQSKLFQSTESNGEKMCRNILREIFGVEFTKQRPDFLKNPKTGQNLELDCYNSELDIAVEYNGKYHYDENSRYYKSKADFEYQKYKDNLKKKLCEKNGTYLIVVPFYIKIKNIKAFIQTKLEKENYELNFKQTLKKNFGYSQ